MTPDSESQVERICHEALALDAAAREVFVADACAGDEALRREVWSLVSEAAEADEFLREPALVAAAQHLAADAGQSLIGRTLGVYQIHSLLGAGGMGEVYRARDTKLGRDVAIKTLPRRFVADFDRLARFGREARMLAALNHQNVGAIYGVEDVDGVPALVLELVDGLTLADRLVDGPLSVRDALAIAAQIAEALDAAHEHGIVHRDLKPANVVLTSNGHVKVLDFGLAKAVSGDASGPSLSQSPTITMDGTKEGVILGTAAYMSPEQTRGMPVDKRADIWSFGCVLYEMLTGRAAFTRATDSDTIAAILEREPEWPALPAATPEPVRRLLRRCLEKDQKRRLRDIGDARIDLEPPRPSGPAGAAVSPDRSIADAPNDFPIQPDSPRTSFISRTVITSIVVAALLTGAASFTFWERARTPSNSTGAVRGEEEAVRATLELYARAIESKNLDLFRQVYPSISAEQEARILRSFSMSNTLQRVAYKNLYVSLHGETATAVLLRSDFLTAGDRSITKETFQIVELARRDGRWVIEKLHLSDRY